MIEKKQKPVCIYRLITSKPTKREKLHSKGLLCEELDDSDSSRSWLKAKWLFDLELYFSWVALTTCCLIFFILVAWSCFCTLISCGWKSLTGSLWCHFVWYRERWTSESVQWVGMLSVTSDSCPACRAQSDDGLEEWRTPAWNYIVLYIANTLFCSRMINWTVQYRILLDLIASKEDLF